MARAWRRNKAPWRWFSRPKVSQEDLEEWQELLFDSCTMCGRCTQICPMGIDIASLVATSRQALASAGLGPPDLRAAAENVRDKGSPLGVTPEVFEDRLDWLADDHEMELPLDKEGAEVLLTVSSIELMKYPNSVVAMGKLLNEAGVNWTFSSKGYSLRLTLKVRLNDAVLSLASDPIILPFEFKTSIVAPVTGPSPTLPLTTTSSATSLAPVLSDSTLTPWAVPPLTVSLAPPPPPQASNCAAKNRTKIPFTSRDWVIRLVM
jgi:ferredoxin